MISLIVIVFLTLGVYLFNFHNGFSSDHSFWGNFGSYFGGVVTPLATIATLIWLLLFNNSQWRQGIKQLEMIEKERSLNNLEFYLQSSISKMQGLINITLFPSEFIFLIEEIKRRNAEIESYKIDDKTLVIYKKGDKVELLRDCNVFTIIHFSISKIGITDTKELIFDKNMIGQKNIILGFLGNMSYLLGYLTRLNNLGYDQLSIKYTLSLFNEYYSLLNQLGIVEENHFRDFMTLRDFPFKINRIQYDFDKDMLFNISSRESKYSELTLNDIKLVAKPFNKTTYETKYIYYIQQFDEYFMWDSNRLLKISKEDYSCYTNA